MNVHWTETAQDHLDAIHAYIARNSAEYALLMVDRLTRRSQQIADAPLSGRRVPEFDLDQILELGDYYNGLARENVTDSSGTYELTEVKPLSIAMTASYLVNSSAAVRCVPFFFGELYATRPSVGEWDETPQLALPVISENRLKRARRSNRFLGRPGLKENGVWLPRSEGDVIFSA